MTNPIKVKICGLTDRTTVEAAVEYGASYVGFVFFRRSPRFIGLEQATELVTPVPREVTPVGLFVDPTDADLEHTLDQVPLRMLQLHGGETPARVAEIKKLTGLPVIKALAVSTNADVMRAGLYIDSVDLLMFDAKPPPDATRPGGNAVAFDWSLMRGYNGARAWFLAGGLNRDNVGTAISQSGATMVDVSSGVETRPGMKSAAKIRAFLAAVTAAAKA